MRKCPNCHQPWGYDSLAEQINDVLPWDTVDLYDKGRVVNFDGLSVEIVEESADNPYNSYGTREEVDIFIIVKVDDRLFKKEGTRDSYGGTEWGLCREVKPTPRTITVYDYA